MSNTPEYYDDVTVGGAIANKETPQEWGQANGDSLWYQTKLSNTWNEFNTRNEVNYKFRENELIEEFKKYIDNTYSGHYGQGGLQSSEVIVDRGHGIGFFLGNVDKYNGRYGKKGEPADHRKDIVKIIHYGFLALYEHDRLNSDSKKV